MTNPIETGPASGTWAWAIQREIDNLQKTVDSRYAELSSRIDRVVSGTEYNADKRALDQQHTAVLDKISNLDKDVEIFKREFQDRLEVLRKEHDADLDKVGLLLDTEKKTREADRKEDREALEATANAQIEKKRWLVAAIMVPIAIALIPMLQMLIK